MRDLKRLKRILEYDTIILYRGSDYEEPPELGVYLSTSKDFAEDYGTVRKYEVSLGNIFDVFKKNHFNMLIEKLGSLEVPDYESYNLPPEIKTYEDLDLVASDTWEVLEQYLSTISSLGFDSVLLTEGGYKNYFVFDTGRVSEVK